MKLSILGYIVLIVLIIGGLNWGFVGLFSFNFIVAVLGGMPIVMKGVYVIIGLAALCAIYLLFKRDE